MHSVYIFQIMVINESFSNVRKKYILAFNDIHVMSA